MNDYSIYLRPLRIEDAAVSYRWRNNPKIWRFTGNRPDVSVTYEMEKEWLARVLQSKDEKRFAICLKGNDAYIGNIYLTDIKDGAAVVHIFIGDLENWGGNRALEAVLLTGAYAFNTLNLQALYSLIDNRHVSSKALAERAGQVQVDAYTDEKTGRQMTKWVITKDMFEKEMHLKFIRQKNSTQKE